MRDRVPGLDGLRAIAVIAVMLYHSHFPGTQLGWIGVELFFVISGFLITRILLELRERPHYLRTFYVRRALRILPVYYLVLVISAALAIRTGDLNPLWLPSYILYLQNYWPHITSSMTEHIPLMVHTWTLAIEEQFYWLWPVAVLVLGASRLRPVVIGLLLGAPLCRLLLLASTGAPFAAFYTLPAQADPLAIGAALALAERAGIAQAAMRRVGVIAILVGGSAVSLFVWQIGVRNVAEVTGWGTAPMSVFFMSALTLLFGGLVAVTAFGARPLIDVLEWRPLTHLGRISYGLYIYNPLAFLVVALLPIDMKDMTSGTLHANVLVVTVTYIFAFVSWRYFETPILRLRTRLAPTTTPRVQPSHTRVRGEVVPVRG